MKFGPVTSELTGLICEHLIRHGQKTGTVSQISPDILDIFSQSLHHMKALYVQMMYLCIIFQFFKGRCHGNRIMFQKCYQCRLIPLTFVALVLENELQYHGLAVRVNSRNDGAMSCKKFRELLPGNSSDNRAYLRTSGMTRPKTGVYSLIWTDFRNLFTI